MTVALHAADIKDFAAAPHNYWTKTPRDRFTKLFEQIKSGALKLDTASPNAYLAGLLHALEIPHSSQLLVFSVTSLQSSLISPRNPRAIYFNEDTYVGYVPGGRFEIMSFDPAAKVVMCSALGQEAKVLEAIKAGAKDFVVKPFQPERVADAVAKALAA